MISKLLVQNGYQLQSQRASVSSSTKVLTISYLDLVGHRSVTWSQAQCVSESSAVWKIWDFVTMVLGIRSMALILCGSLQEIIVSKLDGTPWSYKWNLDPGFIFA
jgi:hypothetical protein